MARFAAAHSTSSIGRMQAFTDFAKAEFGRVDVMFNNAGVMPLSPQVVEESIARAIAYAIEQPNDVDVSEVVVRPTASPF